ncbi:hypothetical protein M422DRAFT_252385, partial [Sphaerobolus stellatus SS14]
MALAASSSPRTLSLSDSDSEDEPNSRGARVFWGNLKTPEKSRTVFVEPPQTVVRPRASPAPAGRRKSARISVLTQTHNSPDVFLTEEKGRSNPSPEQQEQTSSLISMAHLQDNVIKHDSLSPTREGGVRSSKEPLISPCHSPSHLPVNTTDQSFTFVPDSTRNISPLSSLSPAPLELPVNSVVEQLAPRLCSPVEQQLLMNTTASLDVADQSKDPLTSKETSSIEQEPKASGSELRDLISFSPDKPTISTDMSPVPSMYSAASSSVSCMAVDELLSLASEPHSALDQEIEMATEKEPYDTGTTASKLLAAVVSNDLSSNTPTSDVTVQDTVENDVSAPHKESVEPDTHLMD